MNDKTFKLRVPTDELKNWADEAKREGKSISEWIRGRCGILVKSAEHYKELTGKEWKPGADVKFEKSDDQGLRPTPDASVLQRSTVSTGGLCSHQYGIKACPFPGCRNYKWSES